MDKFVLTPDSFKGSMSSIEVCAIMEASIKKIIPGAQVVSIPVADGGEGTVDCFLRACAGKKVPLTVTGPFPGMGANTYYALLHGGTTAVVEVAACAGLPMVEGRANPCLTTTHGLGEMILHAAGSGAQSIIVGLGGSATNDAGCGVAAALGARFLDENGYAFVPTGGTLEKVGGVDLAGLSPLLQGVTLTAMCDIDNPLYGPTGAAHVFAPQKGADEAMVQRLDEGLRHFAEVLKRDTGRDIAALPGGGAAGGLGAGMVGLLGAELKMGIDVVLDAVGFGELVKGAALVFTGEGKLDSQSLRGKVVAGVAKRATERGVPVVAVVGDIGDGIEDIYKMGVTSVHSINRVAVDFSEARTRAKQDLALAMQDLMRFYINR